MVYNSLIFTSQNKYFSLINNHKIIFFSGNNLLNILFWIIIEKILVKICKIIIINYLYNYLLTYITKFM